MRDTDRVLPTTVAEGWPALLTVKQAAAPHVLNTTERHIRKLLQDGRLSFVKVGHLVRIERAELLDFIERNRVAATAQR